MSEPSVVLLDMHKKKQMNNQEDVWAELGKEPQKDHFCRVKETSISLYNCFSSIF